MAVHIDDQALKDAARDMLALRQRNQRLKEKLEKMFQDLTTALDTPAGHAVQWTGKDVLNDPPKMVHRSTKLYPLPANQRALLL